MYLFLLWFFVPQHAYEGFTLVGAETLEFNVRHQSVVIHSPKIAEKMKFRATRGGFIVESVTLVTVDNESVKIRFRDSVTINSFSKEIKIPEGTPAFKEVQLELNVAGNSRATRPKLECWVFQKVE